jgi:ketosteroid isomerase-like protein
MNTRRAHAVLLICVLTPLLASAQKDTKPQKSGGGAEQEITKFLDQSRNAALKGDASFSEANLSDDYQRVNAQGRLMTKADLVSELKNGDLKYQSIEVTDMKVRVYGNAAVVTHGADVKGTNKGKDISGSFRVTRVFVKRNGKWQEVSFQATPVGG